MLRIESPDVVIMTGGRGTRMGSFIGPYGCKGLIPIAGFPAIEYVLRSVRSVIPGRIFLCIDREELFASIQGEVERIGFENIVLYLDHSMRGTMHALYKLRATLETETVLVMYGHHLIPPQHLRNVLERREQGVVLGLYKTSSNNPREFATVEAGMKILRISRGDERTHLSTSEYYIDVPYCFPKEFVHAQQDRAMRSHEAIKEWLDTGGKVYGEIANFPHEFHRPEELPFLNRFARKLHKELGF